jgi:hypothetical protein
MDTSSARASLRVIKSSHKINRQPKIKSAKVAKNNYSTFAHADGLMIYPTIGLGLSIPALIFALVKVAAVLD